MKALCRIALAALFVVGLAVPTNAAVDHRFSVKCDITHTSNDDPIVFPGLDEASAHKHAFFGNRGTTEDPSYDAMLDNPTSCALLSDTAAYWNPVLENIATGELATPTRALVYYRSTAKMADDPVVAFPPDFRFVSNDVKWLCKDSEVFASPPNCDGSPGRSIPPSKSIGLRILFREVCWDGQQLAPGSRYEDHTVPLEAPAGGDRECAAGQVQLPHFQMNIRWPAGLLDGTKWQLHGVHGHGDFWNTWNQSALVALVERCLQPSTQATCGLQQG